MVVHRELLQLEAEQASKDAAGAAPDAVPTKDGDGWTSDALSDALDGAPAAVEEVVEEALDEICVMFGREILKIIPGRVSTEVDAGSELHCDLWAQVVALAPFVFWSMLQ